MTKRTACIYDMDGTLANVNSIRHFVLSESKNFDRFHEESVNVPPNYEVVEMLRDCMDAGNHILVVTARKAQWRNQTAFWLAVNNIPSHALFMRANHDQRKDYLVKKDILDYVRQTWDIVHAVDDNPAIIKLWEEEGISTTHIPGWVPDMYPTN